MQARGAAGRRGRRETASELSGHTEELNPIRAQIPVGKSQGRGKCHPEDDNFPAAGLAGRIGREERISTPKETPERVFFAGFSRGFCADICWPEACRHFPFSVGGA